jgi:excisionase family DNA binding protein
MIDLAKEKLLTLESAAERLLVTKSAIYRWITSGSDGVRLDAAKIGGVWRTSEEAIQRFSDYLTEKARGPSSSIASASPTIVPTTFRTATQRQRDSEAASRALDEMWDIKRCVGCDEKIKKDFWSLQKGKSVRCRSCILKLPNQPFSIRLRAAREIEGLRQTDLESESGVSLGRIQQYERGHVKEPRAEDLAALVRALGQELTEPGSPSPSDGDAPD